MHSSLNRQLFSLSRRFSLLRNQNGEPLPLDSVRNRLAEQRAKGAEIQISEEEEDIMIEALSNMRVDRDSSSGQEDQFLNFHHDSPGSGYGASASDSSHRSTTGGLYSSGSSVYPQSSSLSSLAHPPSSPARSSKRHSNNLFGSGRFRDTSYIRSVKTSTSSRSAVSDTTSSTLSASKGSVARDQTNPTPRAATPEGNGDTSSSSVPSSPYNDDKTPVARTTVLPPTSFQAKTMTAAQVKRASMALEAAIRGLEEDEETIVAPRSAPLSAGIPYGYKSPTAVRTLTLSHPSLAHSLTGCGSAR